MSWPAVGAWLCAVFFAASICSGAQSGPLFWLGALSLDVLAVGFVLVLVRWVARWSESRWD